MRQMLELDDMRKRHKSAQSLKQGTLGESEQATKQLVKMARRTAIDERKAERARVKALRDCGKKSKVIVLRYQPVTEQQHESDSDSKGSFISIENFRSDDDGIEFILHRDRE